MIAAAMRESSDRVGGGGVVFSGRVRRRRRTMYMFNKSYDITRIHEARALAGQKHSKVESASCLANFPRHQTQRAYPVPRRDRAQGRARTRPITRNMAASIAPTHALVVTARPAAVTRARRAASVVRCDASKDAAGSRLATRRDATFGLGAALVAALAAPAQSAKQLTCLFQDVP